MGKLVQRDRKIKAAQSSNFDSAGSDDRTAYATTAKSHSERMRVLTRSTAAEDILEIVMRRYERASTLMTSNRPVEDWRNLLGDSAAVTAMLDRLLHHGHVLKCGPRSWRTKMDLPDQEVKS